MSLEIYAEGNAKPDVASLGRWMVRTLITSYAGRWLMYGALTIGVFQAIYLITIHFGAAYAGMENGPIENAQVVFALLGALALFMAARIATRGRALVFASASAVTYAAMRECDLLFETYVFDDAYKFLVGLPLGVLVAIGCWRQRRELLSDFVYLMKQPAAAMFGVAGLHLCVACQMLDRPMLWSGLEGAVDLDATKMMVEESMELFAYTMVAFSGVEAYVFASDNSAAALDAAAEDRMVNLGGDATGVKSSPASSRIPHGAAQQVV
jgi:hypothetical protein